jgi:hypothetical protein
LIYPSNIFETSGTVTQVVKSPSAPGSALQLRRGREILGATRLSGTWAYQTQRPVIGSEGYRERILTLG